MNQAGGDSRESELQNLLRDERDRCNQYKQIYQTLKEKHSKLQYELTLIHDQLKEATSLNERQKSANEASIRKLEIRVRDQQHEISTLTAKLRAHDEKKIRAAVLEEVSSHYEAMIKDLHVESDKVRDQYNNLHYENAILKCKFDSREAEYSRSLERINLQHQAEIEELKSKIEDLEKDRSSPSDKYVLELKTSKREVLQLSSKIKTLMSECDELRAQNDSLSLQVGSVTRTNSKQISDHMTNIRILESEKMKATMQKEVLEKELANAQEHRRVLNQELQSSRREALSLKSKLEECEHKCRVAVTNLQVEIENWKSSKENEREQFMDEISRLKSELQDISTNLSRERQNMISKEQDLQQSLSAARQQLWKQNREINQEKEKLEHKVREVEMDRATVVADLKQEIQILKQKLQFCVTSKTEQEKELMILKEKSVEQSNLRNRPDEIPPFQYPNYEKEIQNLKEKIEQLSAGTSTEKFQGRDVNSKVHSDYEVMQLKLNWEQQKLQFHQRLEELESQMRESKSSFASEKRELEFKLKQYSRQINRLREKLELQKIQNEDLEIRKDVLEQNIPPETHFQVKNQLAELQRRIEEYRLLISSEPNASPKRIPVLPLSFTGTDIKNISVPIAAPLKRNEKEAPLLKQRDRLEERMKKITRRKSIKTRDRRHKNLSASPVISSSSDIDLENL